MPGEFNTDAMRETLERLHRWGTASGEGRTHRELISGLLSLVEKLTERVKQLEAKR